MGGPLLQDEGGILPVEEPDTSIMTIGPVTVMNMGFFKSCKLILKIREHMEIFCHNIKLLLRIATTIKQRIVTM